jgi:hypothetical protein
MPLLTTRAGASSRAFGFGARAGGAGAMTAIASTLLTSDTATVTFSGIPQTYDDLRISIYEYGDNTYSTNFTIRYNSDSTSSYSEVILFGEDVSFSAYGCVESTSATALSSQVRLSGNSRVMEIYDYSKTTKHKTSFIQTAYEGSSAQAGGYWLQSGTWRSTSAITSITFSISSIRNFDAGSVFSLYGVKRAA